MVNLEVCFAKYVCDLAKEMGIAPGTMARILVVEAITKHRGLSREDLEAAVVAAPVNA